MPTITDWMTSITTIVLAVITGYYAFLNHQIMRFQKKVFDLDRRPFLAFESVVLHLYKPEAERESGGAGLQLGIRVRNVGKVALRYEVQKIVCSINNSALHEPKLVNRGGIVYPTQTQDYSYDTFWGADLSQPVVEGVVEYEIEYYARTTERYLTKKKILVHFFPRSQAINWKTLEEFETGL